MIKRCTRKSETSYPRYGGRGIRVCERWMNSFDDFIADIGPMPGPEYSLERKEANGNYEPGNVIWATAERQARNKRNTFKVTVGGKEMPLIDLCEQRGLNYHIVRQRIRVYKWSVERAIGC
jgi:hypothetical protein